MTLRLCMQKWTAFSFVLVIFMLFASSPVIGQSNYAILGGTVFDPQQRAVPGPDVRLTSVSMRAERRAATNEQGIFQITGLLPGEYSLVIEVQGFASFSRTLRLEVGQQVGLDIDLR